MRMGRSEREVHAGWRAPWTRVAASALALLMASSPVARARPSLLATGSTAKLLAKTGATTQRAQADTSPTGPLSGVMVSGTSLIPLLALKNRDTRLRVIHRLGATQDYRAIEGMVLFLRARDRKLPLTPQEVRAVASAVAPFAGREPVTRLLLHWIERYRRSAVDEDWNQALDSCAMAMASSGAPRALRSLLYLLEQEGRSGERYVPAERAFRALVAHPPTALGPLLEDSSLEHVQVLRLLGELGDVRAIPRLRVVAEKGGAKQQQEAVVALAKLGDGAAAKFVRQWLQRPGGSNEQRIATAQAACLLRDPSAPKAVALLLADPATRTEGLRLAMRCPTPQLAPVLAAMKDHVAAQDRSWWLVALARTGSEQAARLLQQEWNQHANDSVVWKALSELRGPVADSTIERKLAAGTGTARVVRLAVVRWKLTGRTVEGLEQAILRLQASPDGNDRMVGGWAAATLDPEQAARRVENCSPEERLGACSSIPALLASRELQAKCVRRAKAGAGRLDWLAAAPAMAVGGVEPPLSGMELVDRIWQDAALGPVLARWLGAYDGPAIRPHIRRFLNAGGVALRAQMALGLAASPDPSAVALLRSRFEDETSPMVRAAIVRGLSAHLTGAVRKWLAQVTKIEPDPTVRALARAASQGTRLDGFAPGAVVYWQPLPRPPGSEGEKLLVRLLTADGSLMVAPGCAGDVVMFGVSSPRYAVSYRRLEPVQSSRGQQPSKPPAMKPSQAGGTTRKGNP